MKIDNFHKVHQETGFIVGDVERAWRDAGFFAFYKMGETDGVIIETALHDFCMGPDYEQRRERAIRMVAAEVLSKSKVTVLRYCKEGALKPYKAPGAKLTTGVYLSSLNALLNS